MLFECIPSWVTRGGGLRIYRFERTPGNFSFSTLALKIQDKTKLHFWKFHKNALCPSEIPKPKSKGHENSIWFFLDYPWKLHFFLIEPEISTTYFFSTTGNSMFSTPIPPPPPTHTHTHTYTHTPRPSCLDFFWNSPLLKLLVVLSSLSRLGKTHHSNFQSNINLVDRIGS